jgi:hypothetical protein
MRETTKPPGEQPETALSVEPKQEPAESAVAPERILDQQSFGIWNSLGCNEVEDGLAYQGRMRAGWEGRENG